MTIDPFCAHHGMRWSEHHGGRCYVCEICFKPLTPEECVTDKNGDRWNVCPGECAVDAGIEEAA